MKKIILTIAILVLTTLILLPGCSSGGTATTTTTAPASSAPASSTTSAAGNVIELKFSYWPPPADPWVQQGILPWGANLEKITNGKVKVTYFGGATLGAPPDHLDLVKKDTADIGWVNPAFTAGVFPLSDIRNLPFLYPNVQVASKVFWNQQEYMNPIEYKDVKVLWTFPTPTQQLHTVKKVVRTLDDLKGLKFGETEPLAAKTDTAMGIVPVVIPDETQIYTGLERGMLDGRWQEYNGLLVWKTGEVTKYRVDNVNIYVHQNAIMMNLQKYNSLPADIRKAIDDTSGMLQSSASGDIWAKVEQDSKVIILDMDKAKGNPPPYVLPDDERAKWITAAQPAIDGWIKDLTEKGQGAQSKDLLDKTRQWVTEYSK
jgi:TRAP-type C4-dicarboxylate transport system substrate-binding protein